MILRRALRSEQKGINEGVKVFLMNPILGITSSKIFSFILTLSVTALLFSCTKSDSTLDESMGTFRVKWWNYYDRGLVNSENKEWENAVRELAKQYSTNLPP
jgi:hypothetical protein